MEIKSTDLIKLKSEELVKKLDEELILFVSFYNSPSLIIESVINSTERAPSGYGMTVTELSRESKGKINSRLRRFGYLNLLSGRPSKVVGYIYPIKRKLK